MQFQDDDEELEFLRGTVKRLWGASEAGRTTVSSSYDLDYAWDLIEEYARPRVEQDRDDLEVSLTLYPN
jgi:hypothetical protein